MTDFVAIVDGNGDVWGARIPDLPGCHGGGATPHDAVSDATSAAREWLADQAAQGGAVIAPRTLNAVVADPAVEFDPKTELLAVISLSPSM